MKCVTANHVSALALFHQMVLSKSPLLPEDPEDTIQFMSLPQVGH